MNSFLLRFQEPCEDSSVPVAARTQTVTKIAREQPDAYPTASSYRLVPTEIFAGTVTNTRVRNEQGDADSASTCRTIPGPPEMGTRSITAVRMEDDDRDPCQQELVVLPKCSSY